MTIIGTEKHTKKTRRARRCDWCDEMIEVGQPKVSWLWKEGEDFAEVRTHPECFAASQKYLEAVDNYEFQPGSYSRGCGCPNGLCECELKEPTNG